MIRTTEHTRQHIDAGQLAEAKASEREVSRACQGIETWITPTRAGEIRRARPCGAMHWPEATDSERAELRRIWHLLPDFCGSDDVVRIIEAGRVRTIGGAS